MRDYKSENLENIVNKCKKKGYKVYTFESDGPIRQVFIENINGQIGTLSDDGFKESVNTVHKPNRESGTGYQMSENLKDFDSSFAITPSWGNIDSVKKYKSFRDYQKQETILNYYEV